MLERSKLLIIGLLFLSFLFSGNFVLEAQEDNFSQSKGLSDSLFNRGNEQDVYGLVSGLATGLMVARTGADHNRSYDARIRGIGTIIGDQNPILVIDGLIAASQEMIDINDIASVKIIKGPETARYGMFGANGVIEIKTRSFSDKPLEVNFNQNIIFESKVYRQLVSDRAAYLADGGVDLGANTDWMDVVTQTGVSSISNLNLSGTSNNISYKASANARLLNGIMKNTGFDQFNLSGGFAWQPVESLKITYNGNFTDRQSDLGFYEVFKQAYQMIPTQPQYFEGGGIYDAILFDYVNPLNYFEEASHTRSQSLISSGINLNYQLGKADLELAGSYLNQVNVQTLEYSPDFLFGLSVGRSESNGYELDQINFNLNYTGAKKNLGKLSIQETVGGGVFERTINNRERTIEDGQFVDVLDQDYLRLQHFFIGLDADFNKWLSAQMYMRFEKSNLLGEEDQSGFFPSFSAEMAIGELMPNLSGLNLSAGYGIAGLTLTDDDINSNELGNAFNLDEVNNSVTYEQSINSEITLSYGPTNSAWQLSLTRFSRQASNILGAGLNVPGLGAETPRQLLNNAEIMNTGWEMAINSRLKIGSIKVSSDLNFSSLKSEWSEHPISGSTFGFIELRNPSITLNQNDEAYGALRGYKATLTDQNIVFEDANGDGTVDTDDIIPLGQPLPKSWLGWRNEIQFKKVRLSFLLEGVFGHSIINSRSYLNGANAIDAALYNNLSTGLRYNDFPIFPSSLFIENASFLRLRYLSLSHSFEIKEFKITGFMVVNHLFTVTDFTGNDPSPRLSDGLDSFIDVNLSGYQRRGDWLPSRSLMLGLKINF